MNKTKLEILQTKTNGIIDFVLEECHIYSLSDFKPEYLSSENQRTLLDYSSEIRWDFLYKTYGYVNNINKFSSPFYRLLEYVSFQDYPSSLRHKVNIIGSLLECNMHTYVPLHVSIKPKDGLKGLIDVEELKKLPCTLESVCHPGFTRGIGSVFLNTPLKKVFLYVKKEHGIEIKENQYVKKLNKREEIVPYYESPYSGKDLVLDFVMYKGDVKDNVKYHTVTDTPILKVNNITDKTLSKKLHHTAHYKSTTFEYFDKYCKMLFSNKVKIYTNNKNKMYNKFLQNATKLQKNIFNIDFKWRDKNYTIRDDQQKADSHGISSPTVAFSSLPDSKYTKVYQSLFQSYKENFDNNLVEHFLENDHFLGGSEIIETENIEIKDIIKKNNFKGIAIFLNNHIVEKSDRLFYELLFCISPNLSLTRSKCSGLKIINCSHPYWQGKGKFKEAVLNENFFKYE